jgi:hypothetical protein
MPTIPQGPSTTLFASYKKFAKKQRKAQNTLLHYENNAAANIIIFRHNFGLLNSTLKSVMILTPRNKLA